MTEKLVDPSPGLIYTALYKKIMPRTVQLVIDWEPDGYFSDGISVNHQ